jgi:hypothetical protein
MKWELTAADSNKRRGAPLTPETQPDPECSWVASDPAELEALGFSNINGGGVPAEIQERHFSEWEGVSPKRIMN